MPADVLLLFALILLNALFAMSEIALVTARRARLQAMVEQGDTGAAAALALNDHPTRFLSTIQVGITSIGILSGIVGEAALAEPMARWLIELGAEAKTAKFGGTVLVVIVVTYFSIVLGELVPKRLGQISAEGIARRVARPIGWLAMAAKPFVRLLSASTDVLLRVIGARTDSASAVTEEEIHALIQEGSETGVIDEQERAMVRNVFRLDDRQIASLMTPRSEIVYLDLEDDLAENMKRVLDIEHSRFPVCRGGLRDVIGVASARRLLQQAIRGETLDLEKAAEAVVYVPESLTGMELLENFRASSGHMALVVDEYGEIQGVVTAQDLFEAIAGEFKPQRTEDAWAVQRADGSWLLDGLIPIPELKDRLDFGAAPEEELGRYNTLSGMVMLLLGRVPATGDIVEWQGWRFEIVDMDKHRIDKVLASRLPEPEVGGAVD
ncbi:MAG TPA: hemolysin family protein [Burkholderiaceae bacterium]|nr:hemolysin family protein [Burkholderiaceae bacterium]HQR70307.1 hemolysin family protein [Burkholderiaceae bacterium]